MTQVKCRGGKYATPIRQMLDDVYCDGVIFHCKDEREAESVRVCTLIFKERNGYDYKTTVYKNMAKVYKDDRIWSDAMMNIDLRDKEKCL